MSITPSEQNKNQDSRILFLSVYIFIEVLYIAANQKLVFHGFYSTQRKNGSNHREDYEKLQENGVRTTSSAYGKMKCHMSIEKLSSF